MNQEVHDVRLQAYLRKKIKELPVAEQIALKNLKYCGARVKMNSYGQNVGVFLMKSDEGDAKFWGAAMCKSPWACPVCTAKKMNEYARDIACAIEACREKGLKAAMITFTIPHFKFMSCEMVTEVLYNTWKQFMHKAPSNKNASFNNKSMDVFHNFAVDVENFHRVRVTEYTRNKFFGWHPHFHALFWVPAHKLQRVGEWEQKLRKRWDNCVITQYKRYFAKHYPNGFNFPPPHENVKTIEELIHNVFTVKRKSDDPSRKAFGVFISKTDNGKVREALTSDYICGWGSDKEVTGNRARKATSINSMTPHQLLDYAHKHNSDLHFILFVEYALATKKARHARVNYSVHSGLKQLIKLYKQTEKYHEIIKKKFTRAAKWRVLIWFSSEQWSNICELDEEHYLLSRMLAIAKKFDFDIAWDYIYKLLIKFGIDIGGNSENINNDYYPQFEIQIAEAVFNHAG